MWIVAVEERGERLALHPIPSWYDSNTLGFLSHARLGHTLQARLLTRHSAYNSHYITGIFNQSLHHHNHHRAITYPDTTMLS